MSFILDALRKAERKNSQNTVADRLTAPPDGPPKERREKLWPVILLAALIINAGVITAWMLMRQGVEPEAVIAVAAPPSAQHPPEAEQAVVVKNMMEEIPEAPAAAEKTLPAEAPETVREPPQSEAIPARPADPPVVKIEPSPPVYQEPAGIDAGPPIPPSREVPESLPEDRLYTVDELPLHIRDALPDISISAHIYSEKTVLRRAGINDRVLREGLTVAEGLKLVEVTPSGVILLFQGYRFHVDAF